MALKLEAVKFPMGGAGDFPGFRLYALDNGSDLFYTGNCSWLLACATHVGGDPGLSRVSFWSLLCQYPRVAGLLGGSGLVLWARLFLMSYDPIVPTRVDCQQLQERLEMIQRFWLSLVDGHPALTDMVIWERTVLDMTSALERLRADVAERNLRSS